MQTYGGKSNNTEFWFSAFVVQGKRTGATVQRTATMHNWINKLATKSMDTPSHAISTLLINTVDNMSKVYVIMQQRKTYQIT